MDTINKNNIILIRCGEIALKGLNRNLFEGKLINNIKKALFGIGDFKIWKSQSRFYIELIKLDYNIDAIIEKLKKVFGIVSLSLVERAEPSYDSIRKICCETAQEIVLRNNFNTFKVESRRGDKTFPLTSVELSAEIGADILNCVPELKVDVHKPDFTIYIEVREEAYIYSEITPACGGMPTGTSGRGLLLLSGGIDSPVAGWMLAKRGMALDAVHFFSYPYTGLRSKEKVIELANILSEYVGELNLHIIPFTNIQEAIRDKCPEDHMTIITRRLMMELAEKLAISKNIDAIITGESLGQVASQTIQGLTVTDAAVSMPVFRPLIGMDKNEVIGIAKKIGTFETSILPYEDCCTIFNSKHPCTKPRLEKVIHFEDNLDKSWLIENALASVETMKIRQSMQREEDLL